MLVPCNWNNVHWTLVVVDFDNKRIEHYDTKPGYATDISKVFSNLKEYVDEEAKRYSNKHNFTSDWESKVVTPKNVPKQANDVDCGVFLCMFAKLICQGKPYTLASAAQTRHYRMQILEELVTKTIHPWGDLTIEDNALLSS